jgi:hypothetical protein
VPHKDTLTLHSSTNTSSHVLLYNNKNIYCWTLSVADYVKYSFPIATSMTTLAWSLVEFSKGYAATGSLATATSQLRWGADYLQAAHITPSSFVVQVSKGAHMLCLCSGPELNRA